MPRSIRYDLGERSDLNGNRRVLYDRSRKQVVTFLPEPPAPPGPSESILRAGTTYEVRVDLPGREVYRSAFTTVAADAPVVFDLPEACPVPGIVNVYPSNGQNAVLLDGRVYLRFSDPVDPQTVTGDHIRLEIVSLPARPVVPCTYRVRQTRTGPVEVILTPQADLPPNQIFLVSMTEGVQTLKGAPLVSPWDPRPWMFSFTTSDGVSFGQDLDEDFGTNSRENVAATTADWNGSIPGALVAAPGADRKSVAESYWYDQGIWTPVHDPLEANLDANEGEIEILFQGAEEDVTNPGNPVDPDSDPARERTTDWLPPTDVRRLDHYQFLRFRVLFRNPADRADGDLLPIVRRVFLPVRSRWP